MPVPSFSRAVTVAPSILSADFAALGAEITAVQDQGADWIHVDVMDGHFVPNITLGPAICSAIRPHISGVMDVHLMIAPPEPMLDAFAASGADILTVHAEATTHLDRTLAAIRDHGIGAGVALNPSTPPEVLDFVLDRIDLVCVMTVNPGFGGQSFLDSQLPKIARLAEMIGDRPVRIEVDGGVTTATAGNCAAMGASVLVAGSGVFSGGSVADPAPYGTNIRAIKDAATAAIS